MARFHDPRICLTSQQSCHGSIMCTSREDWPERQLSSSIGSCSCSCSSPRTPDIGDVCPSRSPETSNNTHITSYTYHSLQALNNRSTSALSGASFIAEYTRIKQLVPDVSNLALRLIAECCHLPIYLENCRRFVILLQWQQTWTDTDHRSEVNNITLWHQFWSRVSLTYCHSFFFTVR